jgi:hypothetical protein
VVIHWILIKRAKSVGTGTTPRRGEVPVFARSAPLTNSVILHFSNDGIGRPAVPPPGAATGSSEVT